VLFIVKQRVLDKGVKIVFWWTRFIPDFSGDEALLAHRGNLKDLEKGTAVVSTAEVIITSVVSAAASLVASLSPSPSSLAMEGDKARGSDDRSSLETTFTQMMNPFPSIPDSPEPTIFNTSISSDNDTHATTRTSERSTHVVDEL
jgi:protein transport protein SEC20